MLKESKITIIARMTISKIVGVQNNLKGLRYLKVNRDILDNLCINITDGEHASVQNDDEGKYFLLSNKNIINGRIIVTENERKISKETFNKINKRTKLEKGDLVISTVGILEN